MCIEQGAKLGFAKNAPDWSEENGRDHFHLVNFATFFV